MGRACLGKEGRGHEQDLSSLEDELPVKLWEPHIVTHTESEVANRREARLCYSFALHEASRFLLFDTVGTGHIDVEHVHLAVLGLDVALLINNGVSEVVLAGSRVLLGEAAE